GSALAKLTSAISASATDVDVGDYRFIPVGVPLLIDDEIVSVVKKSGTLILLRGQANTIATSHAANSSVRLAYDQRGVLRTANDLGSIAVTPPIVVTSLSDVPVPGKLTLREAIGQANLNLVSRDTITFAPGLRGKLELTRGELLIKKGMVIAGPGADVIEI